MNELSTRWINYTRKMKEHTPQSELIGYYSIDDAQNYVQDISQLKYFTFDAGKVNFDLNKGIYTGKTHLNTACVAQETFFKYLKNHQHLLNEMQNDDIMKAGIVTNRGCLRSLLELIYRDNEQFAFVVHYIRNNIYLTQPMDSWDKSNTLPAALRGHIFENYVLSESPNEKPNPSKPVNEFCGFIGIYKETINTHELLVKCEIDGVLANSEDNREKISDHLSEERTVEELKKRRFMELKSIRYTEDYYARVTTRRIWTQCVHNNIEDIYMGFKFNNFVTSIEKTTLKELEGKRKGWSPKVCLNFCDEFLTFIKMCLRDRIVQNGKSEKPISLYFIRYPNRPIIELPNHLPARYIIDYVPEWYMHGIKNKRAMTDDKPVKKLKEL